MTWQSHEKRSRPIHFHLWASEEEAALIRERMAASGVSSFSAFARKMLIDGYHVNIDLTDVREMVRLLKNATDNINQIAKRANETRSVYAEDVEDLRRRYDSLWDAAGRILTGLAKIK
jgi:adenine C2-methylase RlmN of 23S rRNA A2503 and tRNA A37